MSNNINDRDIELLLVQAIAPVRLKPGTSAAVRTYCPLCGYDLSGAIDPDPVRCPECGARAYRRDLLATPPPGFWMQLALAWRTPAMVGSVVGCAFLAFVFGVGALSSRCSCGNPVQMAKSQLVQIHKGCLVYAADYGGAWPAHAAQLVPDGYLQPELLIDPRISTSNSVLVGQYDLMTFDWKAQSQSQALLDSAIQSTDLSAPYYRAGDFWLVRASANSGDGSLIAAWAQPDARGERIVVFQDNRGIMCGAKEWLACCRVDAERRAALGLPPVALPR